MKRSRYDSDCVACDEGRTPPPRDFWGSISPFKAPHASVKRRRDRSVPVDALSFMMTVAVTHARIKRHSIKRLFGAASGDLVACAACESVERQPKQLLEPQSLQRCAHCERRMGSCCARECDACGDVFCSLCSTLNCDEQLDRVFCLACNQEQCRG